MNTNAAPTKAQLEAALAALEEIGVSPEDAYAAAMAIDAVPAAAAMRDDDYQLEEGEEGYGWRDEVSSACAHDSARVWAGALSSRALQMGEILGLTDGGADERVPE